MVIGGIAIVMAIVFFAIVKDSFYEGAAIPLFFIGVWQLFGGLRIYRNNRARALQVSGAVTGQQLNWMREELARIVQLIRRFSLFKWIEMIIVVAGLGMIFYYRADPLKQLFYGFGLYMTVIVLITLVADYAAERRAFAYKKGLQDILTAA